MKSLKFIFIVLILLSITNAAMAQEYLIKIDKDNRVWITPPGASTQFAGTLETIPKGTRLYHWGIATPERAKAWNDAGKISPELLERLKQGHGFVGGGFYVSKDPTDSSNFGNTQVVVELPKDIHVINSTTSVGWGAKLWPAIEKAGISGVIVSHTLNWINIIDAEALTNEFVATGEFYKKNHLTQLTSPNLLKHFLTKFPDLESDPFYQELLRKTEKLFADVISKDRKTAMAAFTEIFENANDSSKRLALHNISSNDSYTVFSDKKTVDLAFNSLKGGAFLAQGAIDILTQLTLQPRQINHYVFSKATRNRDLMTSALSNMKQQLSPERYSALLQEAEYYLKKENLFYIKQAIEELKKEGKWNPPMMCELVFR